MKSTLLKRILLVLCPLILLVVLKLTVEFVRFASFVNGIHHTTTPFQKQIALSNGAQLLAQGETNCGGMTGDCAISARVRIRWQSGVKETVVKEDTFDEFEIDSARLSRPKGQWQLRFGDQTWTRLAENAWMSGAVSSQPVPIEPQKRAN